MSPRKPRFEERYARVTSYVDKDLLQEIQELRIQGAIGTMTQFVNEAFAEYLSKHFPRE